MGAHKISSLVHKRVLFVGHMFSSPNHYPPFSHATTGGQLPSSSWHNFPTIQLLVVFWDTHTFPSFSLLNLDITNAPKQKKLQKTSYACKKGGKMKNKWKNPAATRYISWGVDHWWRSRPSLHDVMAILGNLMTRMAVPKERVGILAPHTTSSKDVQPSGSAGRVTLPLAED